MMYNEIMKNKFFVFVNILIIGSCLFFTACASKQSKNAAEVEELLTEPHMFEDWKYKGFGQEYPLWAEAVLEADFDTVMDLLNLPQLDSEKSRYRADIFYGQSVDALLKYENLTDEEVVAETWCRISPYYEQYEESYVYIVIHVEE